MDIALLEDNVSPENEQKLLAEFPNLYRNYYEDKSVTCMCWGFAHDDGWFNIIYELSHQIEDELQKKTDEFRKEFAVDQVKEKYGTLRYYTNIFDDDIENLIDHAEELSAVTCERCGGPGSLKNLGSWLKTLCSDCLETVNSER